jgi:purine-binding chemotaxis protein CheW
LRGKIIPIIDLKARLALGAGIEESKKQRVLILKGRKGLIGALIDRVIGVIRLPESKIEETPPHLLETEMRFVDGVALVDGRFISILKTAEAMDYEVGNGR